MDASPSLGFPNIAAWLSGVAGRSPSLTAGQFAANNTPFNVADYARVGDADDTASFTRAVAALTTAGGGTLLVPWRAAGFFVSQEIALPSNCTVEVRGQVTQTVSGYGIFTANGASYLSIVCFAPLVGFSSTYNATNASGVINLVSCTDVYVQPIVTAAEFYGVVLTDAVRFVVTHGTVRNFGYAGIMFLVGANNGCEEGMVLANHVKNCTRTDAPSSYGIAFGCASAALNMDHRYIVVADNIVEDVPRWNGLDLHGGQHVQFRNNIVKNCRRGIECILAYSNTSTPHLTDVDIIGNRFFAATTDVGAQPEFGINFGGSRNGATGYTASRIRVLGNYVEGFNKFYGGGSFGGICWTNVSDWEVSDNVVYDNAQNGLCAILQATTDTLMNGLVANNSVDRQAGTAGTYALQLGTAGANGQYANIAVHNNRFRTYTYAGYAQSSVTNGSFVGNDVSGTGSAFNGTPANFGMIRDNVGFVTRAWGVTGAVATGALVNHGLALAPSRVLLTPASGGSPTNSPYVTGVTATQFAINFAGGASLSFYWEAEV